MQIPRLTAPEPSIAMSDESATDTAAAPIALPPTPKLTAELSVTVNCEPASTFSVPPRSTFTGEAPTWTLLEYQTSRSP